MNDWNDILRRALEPCDPTHQLEEKLNTDFSWNTVFVLRALAIRDSEILHPKSNAKAHAKVVARLKSQILAQLLDVIMLTTASISEFLVSTTIETDDMYGSGVKQFSNAVEELVTKDLGYSSFAITKYFWVYNGKEFVHYLLIKFH